MFRDQVSDVQGVSEKDEDNQTSESIQFYTLETGMWEFKDGKG